MSTLAQLCTVINDATFNSLQINDYTTTIYIDKYGKETDGMVEYHNVPSILITTDHYTYNRQNGISDGPSSRPEFGYTASAMSNNLKNEHKMSNLFIKSKTIFLAVVIIIGFVANTFSLMVIIKQGLIKSGLWVFIGCLSISDNLTIITFFLYEFSKNPVNLFGSLSMSNDFTCKLLSSFQFMFSMISIYFLVFLTCERAVLILRPYRQPTSQKQAIVVVITITILISSSYLSWCFSAIGILQYPASVLGGDYGGMEGSYGDICIVKQRYDFNF